jgi:hypothetical protein
MGVKRCVFNCIGVELYPANLQGPNVPMRHAVSSCTRCLERSPANDTVQSTMFSAMYKLGGAHRVARLTGTRPGQC